MQRVNLYTEQGGVTVNTGGLSSTTKVMGVFPGVTVTVFTANTIVAAVIYSDNGITLKSNPFTSDSNTGLGFFYSANGHVDVQFSGTGFSTFTLADIILNDPADATTMSTLTVANIDNRIFVDGVKYPLTQAGVQAAITDACAINLGGSKGTTLYLPPCNIASTTGYSVTSPIKIIGAGPGLTALVLTGAGPVFRLKGSANFSQNQEWDLSNMEIVCTAGDCIILDDTSGFAINRFYLHDTVCQAAAASFAVNMTLSIANSAFDMNIERNYLLSGINLTGNSTLGSVDGVYIANNVFDPALGATTAAINLNQMLGAASPVIFHNRGGLSGGFVVSTGCTQPKIINNQIEITTGTGSANGAAIDLQGTTYTIDGGAVKDNNINCHTNATIGIRLDRVTNTNVSDNVIGIKPATGVGVAFTANASDCVLGPNEFVGTGGGAVAVTDLSTRLQRLGNKANNTINTVLFTNADGQQALLLARRANTQTADIFDVTDENGNVFFAVTAAGAMKARGSTSGTSLFLPAAIAGGNFTLLDINSGPVAKAQVAADFTTANNTSLQTITGLSFTVLANARNLSFYAAISYSQATANVAVAFGIQVATNAPTNVFAHGIQQITVGPPATFVAGTLPTLSTTTATNIVSGTPTALATNYTATLEGTIELPASANTINIMVSTANGADAVTVKRGSYCQLF